MCQLNKTKIAIGAALMISGLSATPLNAAVLDTWDSSWYQIAAEDQNTWFLDPGYGGQLFDAEYLYYQYDSAANNLSIGLQTGFDITDDGAITFSGQEYFTGDIALSFDGAVLGDESTYEFGIDFGTYGFDAAGLYAVSGWSDVAYSSHSISNPLAMTSGSLITPLALDMGSGIAGGDTSYFVKATINLADLGLSYSDLTNMDVHWTMSCGNDAIDAHVSVPEPSTLLLLSTSLLGLIGIRGVKQVA